MEQQNQAFVKFIYKMILLLARQDSFSLKMMHLNCRAIFCMDSLHVHRFGGNWTLIKLEVLKRYLEAFNTALQNKPSSQSRFRRIYIDAFAGTGECAIQYEGQTIRIDGSARLALDTNPGFDEFYFIDLKPRHGKALNHLAQAYPGKVVEVLVGDGNARVAEIIQGINWRDSRAVMFLDPYGMAVQWDTLKKVAATGAIDLWYLFPISAACRQAAHQYDKVDDSKAEALNKLFGTSTWRDMFYKEDTQADLFAPADQELKLRREVNQAGILKYMQQRLRTLFPMVLNPIMLPDQGAPFFALFFASANPHPKAIHLTRRIAGHLLNMHAFGRLGHPSSTVGTQSEADRLI